jgi:IS1 family transposase
MGVCRDTGLITGWAVMTERSVENMQQYVDELPPAIFHCTDGFSVYKELVWPAESEHLIGVKKERTHTIESINAQLRTYLGRLKRRSRCFSRSLKALRQAIRLLVWHYNRRQRLINSNPKRWRNRLPLLF